MVRFDVTTKDCIALVPPWLVSVVRPGRSFRFLVVHAKLQLMFVIAPEKAFKYLFQKPMVDVVWCLWNPQTVFGGLLPKAHCFR
jgi:hypothetical protein